MRITLLLSFLIVLAFSCKPEKNRPNLETPSKPAVSEVKKSAPAPAAKSIELKNMGVGGGQKNAFWVTCANHHPSTQVFINDKAVNTTWAKDHMTAFIPGELRQNGNFTIQLKDTYKKVVSKKYNATYDKVKGEATLKK